MELMEKLTILSDAAKYDAACTSSGVDRVPEKGGIGSSSACGICHSFAADGRCVQDPGTYSPQHSDLRLLAIPASCSRVADYNPN